ncbi:MAG: beta-ketoacyl-[acyl-carrier-protein] synthase family protein [Puniceicoccales bacterium]|jgi:3-oxoacyl-[acyl-carrier-protein] synthase II|nr:beta-ketoacyl-[acyl-carrier-protein] synthase family protein [Puniceicoccales bacterium]
MSVWDRIVITGVGLTSPNGNCLSEFRRNLLEGCACIQRIDMRYMGVVLAGVCTFNTLEYQTKKEVRVGTRAGSIGVYCAHEAIKDGRLDWDHFPKDRVGVYVGITEHGNVETENEIYHISQFGYDVRYWSHHHNPRTIANNPAGEITLNLGITGPHYTLGAACAGGNIGLIQGTQMLRLNEVDLALVGGVSESIHSFGNFASFKTQGALAENVHPNRASRPFDKHRNGIVISEGGCLFTLERLADAQKRGARIYGEVLGYGINSDAQDTVLPCTERQVECIRLALKRAQLEANDIDIVSTHATATQLGDARECEALRTVFGTCPRPHFNNTKSFIGHAMGAAGALELAGNLPSFEDGYVHPTINLEELDPACELPNLVVQTPKPLKDARLILNNSFGMLGINSVLIVGRYGS